MNKVILLIGVLLCMISQIHAQDLALIPLPKEVNWKTSSFLIKQPVRIFYSNEQARKVAQKLSHFLKEEGIQSLEIAWKNEEERKRGIFLGFHEIAAIKSKEAYEIEVTSDRIDVNANTTKGLLHGIQTLRQLLVNESDETYFQACTIKDWPAYQWRGIMHDVGRSFLSIGRLKEQVRVMSQYKMNIFHWHLTEDIAWRLEIKQYPQLTLPEHMERNPGEYYTQEEVKDFLAYCRDLGVTVVPEIDMPGHSAAFTRAMGVDMQSSEGLIYCQNILKEVCELFDSPYIHIGSDEVNISRKAFLPAMAKIIRAYGKEVMGWHPGGRLDEQAVQQLWTGNPKPMPGIKTVDSRHLYLNHNDPLAGVIKTFRRQICDADVGNQDLLGGTICVWNDRRPAEQKDIFLMNGVYPSLLAFAERSWVGGGETQATVSMAQKGTEEYQLFKHFEERLIIHKQRYFEDKIFPYVQQSQLPWKIIGPYPNEGDLSKAFAPEKPNWKWSKLGTNKPFMDVHGATIWLRHCWASMLNGHFSTIQAPPNSTVYALQYAHVEKERKAWMWISFHNPSRSERDDTPEAGNWDFKNSKIWLNGQLITPPVWSKPGRKGHAEAPYIDESFEMRVPIPVTLKKGRNTILVKAPIGAFESEHTRLVKWMFTAVLLEWDGQNLGGLKEVEYSVE